MAPSPRTAADAQVMLVVRLDTRPGAEAQMSEALAQLADATRRHDRGVVRFEIGLDPVDGTRVVGYEIWESQDSLAEHSAKEHTQRFLTSVGDLVVDPAEPLRAERWQPLCTEAPADYAAFRDSLRAPAPLPAGFRSEHRQIGDARLHYVIGGSGPLVVLLHGFPNTWYAWRDVMRELAQTMTVVALDLRGLGDSEAGTQPNDVPTGAQDLALLIQELDIGPAFVAGQDWGGSTAFACASAHAESVRALAVIEAMPAGPWTDLTAPSPWFVGFHQIPDLPEQLVRGRERVYLDWLYQAFSATPGVPDTTAVDEYLRTYAHPGAMASAFARYRTIDSQIAHNTRYAGQPIATPTLAIGGDRSFGAVVAENLRNAVSSLHGEVLDGCGHFVSEERPRELARHLRQFFSAHSDVRATGPRHQAAKAVADTEASE
jgi:pimeloyl-ACP methyl ester carboxylesterase/quinol monooxygenase YgiN